MSLNKAFREIGKVRTERSAFDLSHTNLSTHNMGVLYPVMCKFTMPGDKWIIDIESIIRAMPLNYPAYVDMLAEYAVFFSPSRLLDDDFEEFITGGEDGDFSKVVPKLFDIPLDFDKSKVGSFTAGTGDYIDKRLGLFPYLTKSLKIYTASGTGNNKRFDYNYPRELLPTSLPLRAYYQIWDQYFRNENLQSSIFFKKINTAAASFLFNPIYADYFFKDKSKIPSHSHGMFYVNWLKDYFTSALPFQQRGTAPIIPFDGSIEVNSDVNSSDIINIGQLSNLFSKGNAQTRYLGTDRNAWGSGNVVPFNDFFGQGNRIVFTKGSSTAETPTPIELNITASSLAQNLLKDIHANIFDGLSISDLRVAVQLQKFFERNARGGIRYTEFLTNHFNVSPTDSRLDRAEYIGGTRFPIVISDVTSTAATEINGRISDLGSYSGKAVSGNQSGVITSYFVEEFGYILVLFWIRPKTAYFQGIPREFQYSTSLEYPYPEFMHLSEQGITNSELYVTSASDTFDPTKIFGYQGIYDELRWSRNTVSGKMAVYDTRESYYPWHLARVFNDINLPFLNSTFCECKPRADIFQVTDISDTPEFIMEHSFKIKCVRPMPIIGEPGLIDHF